MALSYVNSSSNRSTTTSVAIAKPASVIDDDILIAFVTAFWATNRTAGTVTAPAGWNVINTRAISTRYQVGIFWKRASSEGTSYSFTSTSATRMQGAISAYRGAVTSGNPYAVLSNTLYGTSGTVVRAASLTPSSEGMYVVWGGWYYASTATSLTKPAAMTLLQTQSNTTNALTLAHGIFTPGSATGIQDGAASASCTVKHAYMVDILAAPDAKTQTATANIAAKVTRDQTAAARIGIIRVNSQTAVSKIQRVEVRDQFATASIAQIFSYNQVAAARIYVVGIKINGQFATARIQKYETKVQSATARIEHVGIPLAQYANARIQVIGNTISQTSTARIILAGVVNVIIDSPIDGAITHDSRPTLYFTGAESSNNNIEYYVQFDTTDTFNSSPTGQPMISKYSDGLINYRATGNYNSASSTTAVVPAPAGLNDGDLVFVAIRRSAAINPNSVPSDWTLIRSTLATYGFWIYYKIANNEGASWTWTWAASTRTLAYSYAFWGDYDHNNPIQSSTIPYSATGSGTIISIPTQTTAVNNTMSVILSSAYSTSAKTFTVPTSPTYIERSDTGNTSPDFWQAIASYVYPNANTVTGVISYPVSALSTYRIGCQILVNPSPDLGFMAGHPYGSGAQTNYRLPSPLPNGTYYWRVRGKAPLGNDIYGPWETASFTILDGVKIWNGTSWVYKPARVWNGASWSANSSVKVWDGNNWVTKG